MARQDLIGVSGALRCGAASAALGVMLFAGTAALAQEPNETYFECTLNSGTGNDAIDTVAGLQQDIENSSQGGQNSIANAEIAYVIVAAIDNDNNGQPITAQNNVIGFTGFVVCVAPGFVANVVTQTTPTGNVDIRDVQEAIVVRTTPPGGGDGKNRVCLTADANTDCADIE